VPSSDALPRLRAKRQDHQRLAAAGPSRTRSSDRPARGRLPARRAADRARRPWPDRDVRVPSKDAVLDPHPVADGDRPDSTRRVIPRVAGTATGRLWGRSSGRRRWRRGRTSSRSCSGWRCRWREAWSWPARRAGDAAGHRSVPATRGRDRRRTTAGRRHGLAGV